MTNTIVARTFTVNRPRFFTISGLALLATLAAVYGLATTRWRELSPDEKQLWLALLATGLVGGSWLLVRASRQLRGEVSVDFEGIWPARARREDALIRWGRIAASRDRFAHFALLDREGRVLIRLPYQLDGSDQLAELVASVLPRPHDLRLPAQFSLPARQYLLWLIVAVAVPAGWYFGFIAALLSVFFIVWYLLMQIARMPIRIVVEQDFLRLDFLHRRRTIGRHEIASFTFGNDADSSRFKPRVHLQLEDRSRYILKPGDIGSLDLKLWLDTWLAADQNPNFQNREAS